MAKKILKPTNKKEAPNLVSRQIRSETKYLRISPRKLGLIVESIKGLLPKDALDKLAFMPQKGASILAKAIKTAISNAVSNFKISQENLQFKKVEICQGPTYKRWNPVSRGMAHQYKKRTSHIKIILEEKGK